MQHPCAVTGCAALAEPGGEKCAVHAAGYGVATFSLRCGRCLKPIRTGQGYRRVGTDVRHANPCKVHPDVAKEQKEAAAK